MEESTEILVWPKATKDFLKSKENLIFPSPQVFTYYTI